MTEPSWRKPAGIAMMLALVAVWSALVLTVAPEVAMTAWPIQALFYALAGTLWIAPLKPLLMWMETGKWRE